ncbi:Protein phosphatase 1D [Nymphon striatum]|nr:Protein phosphatase 1D [Nymphon striatum]
MKECLGINLRVTGFCNQGGRKYMEDTFTVTYQESDGGNNIVYAYFGIFDGHGGREAAMFAKDHLREAIVNQKNFWSKNDDDVLKAIKDGFIHTHHAMWKVLGKWPKTASGLPSTAGTTASIVFIRRSKLYIGHVGDSSIVLGNKDPTSKVYSAQRLTRDHKPGSPSEKKRIENLGGCVMSKSGVQRVVWNRPRVGHKGPVRRSTHIDQIPFLAVARSLGDLWSYSYEQKEFIVSPEPDVSVVTIDTKRNKCLILGSDGLWNVVHPEYAVHVVQKCEERNEYTSFQRIKAMMDEEDGNKCDGGKKHSHSPHINPSQILVEQGISRWLTLKKTADNTSVIAVMLDPPGPSKFEVLQQEYLKQWQQKEYVEEIDDTPPYEYDFFVNRNYSSLYHGNDIHKKKSLIQRLPEHPHISKRGHQMYADNAYDILRLSDNKLNSDDNVIVNRDLSHTLEPTSLYEIDKDSDAATVFSENVSSNNAVVGRDEILPQYQKQKSAKRKLSVCYNNCSKVQKFEIDNRTCKSDEYYENHLKTCTRSRLKST